MYTFFLVLNAKLKYHFTEPEENTINQRKTLQRVKKGKTYGQEVQAPAPLCPNKSLKRTIDIENKSIVIFLNCITVAGSFPISR